MPESMSVQILTQTSENIQKLFELSTRIDERVKSIQSKQDRIDHQINDVINQYIQLMQKIAVLEVLESRNEESTVDAEILNCEKQIVEIDKRLSRLENEDGKKTEKWKGIVNFIVQLVWIVIAAYILTKLNLQAPAVP